MKIEIDVQVLSKTATSADMQVTVKTEGYPDKTIRRTISKDRMHDQKMWLRDAVAMVAARQVTTHLKL